jgi:S-adenosylmethionine hydrolase
MPTRVTLTTDFGTRDAYVAQLKGVLYALGPSDIEVIDLTHEIGAGGVLEAGLFIRAAWPRFPAGTIHIVVVDPGVGSPRRALALQHADQLWLGPDNGVMSTLIDANASTRAYELQPERFTQSAISATFHGRDVFAPAAALLARGTPVAALGRPVVSELVRAACRSVVQGAGRLEGEVIHVDRFGNLITNLTRAQLAQLAGGDSFEQLRVCCGAGTGAGPWLPIVRFYAEGVGLGPVALIGSSEQLEVAVTQGDAARQLQVGLGTAVLVVPAAS